VPLTLGGRHERDNIAAAHRRCNLIKRGLHPDHMPLHLVRKFHAELEKRSPPPNWPR
jgi:5-methylcytosine-specific restriction endonuclease McrA